MQFQRVSLSKYLGKSVKRFMSYDQDGPVSNLNQSGHFLIKPITFKLILIRKKSWLVKDLKGISENFRAKKNGLTCSLKGLN